MRGRHKLRGQPRTRAKKELFHLFHQERLRLWCPWLQPVLIQQHLLALPPLAPRRLRHVLVNLLSKLRVEGRFVQPLHLFLVAGAKNHVRHRDFGLLVCFSIVLDALQNPRMRSFLTSACPSSPLSFGSWPQPRARLYACSFSAWERPFPPSSR